MKWTEQNIARALAWQFFNRKYLVVVPNCNWTGYECDLLCVTENLRVIDIEIKISRSDLKADAKKDKWWHRFGERYNPEKQVYERGKNQGRDWPPKVWKHYYALPAEIWDDGLLDCLPSKNSGVLLLSNDHERSDEIRIACRRGAKAQRDAVQISDASVIQIARLASLRMWDAHLDNQNKQQAIDSLRKCNQHGIAEGSNA